MKRIGASIILSAVLAVGVLGGCASGGSATSTAASSSSASASSASATASSSSSASSASSSSASASSVASASGTATADSLALSVADLFTDRDLEQVADTSDATEITVTSGEDVEINEEGVFVVSGTADDVTITVDADDSAKVQIVLDGVSITNEDAPAIYVKSADKVFVTTASGTTNTLAVTGAFAATSDDNVDGVIFSKEDLVLNGEGKLVIDSSDNGIVGKDDVKVTGGTYGITAVGNGIEGKDSVAIADGTFTVSAGNDGVHAENSDDATLGYVYIADGTFGITAASDGVEGASVVQVDGGTFDITAAEGIEGTYVQVNDGTVVIVASDDGINATSKSTAYDVALEINGGAVTIDMDPGDTDALDSNGDLIINGGTVDITAQFAFDFDGVGELNGGTVTVNGEQVTELENSMMGGQGGGRGGQGGQGMGGQGGQGGQGNPQGTMR